MSKEEFKLIVGHNFILPVTCGHYEQDISPLMVIIFEKTFYTMADTRGQQEFFMAGEISCNKDI